MRIDLMVVLRSSRPMRGRRLGIRRLCLSLSVSAILLVCCKRPESTVIAFIPETSGAELWESAHGAAEMEAKEYGLSIYWNAPPREDDVQRQIALVQRAIQNPVAGLILAPDHHLALLNVLHETLERNIPVVVIRSQLPVAPQTNLSFVVSDEDAIGQQIADRISFVLREHGEIAIVGMAYGSDRLVRRLDAIQKHLASEHHELRVVDIVSGTVNIAEDQQLVTSLGQNHPRLDGIVALDSSSLRGSWSAKRGQALPEHVKLIGCDREMDIMRGIRLGEIDSIITEDTGEMAREAVRLVARGHASHSAGTLRQIKPVLISKANLDTPAVQAFLSLDWGSR